MGDSAISLLKRERELYEKLETEHFFRFACYVVLLMVDFSVIIFIRAVTLDAMAWAGIIFLFVLIAIEVKQVLDYRKLKGDVDSFYLRFL
jgi:hypothetical protein